MREIFKRGFTSDVAAYECETGVCMKSKILGTCKDLGLV
jgi:hypothetical protein